MTRKHQDIIDRMTRKERAAFLSGRNEWSSWNFNRLGIPSIFMSDGTSGVRKQEGAGDHLGLNPSVRATCFPCEATVCNSWDVELAEEIGQGLGAEAAAEGVQVILAPALNIKRNPLCGRNFEYYSEDPYLTGKMAAAEVKGLQSQGIGSCLKHFAVNSQETRRMCMDAVIDERTLREIYLTAFEIAVQEGRPLAVMSSYNQVNGIYTNENHHLLMEILRKAWGFDGYVVTDWGGSNDHVLGVKNGSTLEMPNPGLDSARQLLKAVEDGRLSQDDIDDRVDELLDVALRLGKNAEDYRGRHPAMDKKALHDRNHILAGKAAAESMVLLRNEDHILPLDVKKGVAVIGDFAFVPRYQGSGSSNVNSTRVETIEQEIGSYGLSVTGLARGYRRNGTADPALQQEAVALASRADVVLLFFGLNEQYESEGLDRRQLGIPDNQIDLIHALAGVNPNLIGIVCGGSVMEMPWRNSFKGLLYAGLSGQAGASAMLDILTGKVNPSGHLTETIPEKYEDTPSLHYYPAKERTSEYRESLFVGYRYYTTADVPVAYPFGFGLSYTTFACSDLLVTAQGVTFVVTNTGTRDGAAVLQLYIGKQGSQVFRPAKELKGFARVFVQAGASETVSIPFDDRTFRYWNSRSGQWAVEDGSYQVYIGESAEKVALSGEIRIKGTDDPVPCEKGSLPSYESGRVQNVSDAEYRILLGHAIPDGNWNRKELGVNDALCQMSYAKSGIARKICQSLEKKLKTSEAKDGVADLNTVFQYNMPFRAIAKMTAGMVSMEMVEAIVCMVNGHFWRGLGGVIRGFFANRKANEEYLKEISQER